MDPILRLLVLHLQNEDDLSELIYINKQNKIKPTINPKGFEKISQHYDIKTSNISRIINLFKTNKEVSIQQLKDNTTLTNFNQFYSWPKGRRDGGFCKLLVKGDGRNKRLNPEVIEYLKL